MKPWALLEPLLVDPETHEPLREAGAARIATATGASYALMGGVPILRAGDVKTIDPRHESNPVNQELQDYMRGMTGPVLFLGAGSTSFRADNVFEVEYNLFRNTDLVADAHHLPVADGSIAAVVGLNLFEHLADPAQAAREILRVLRPGGEVFIHTAFLQPLHEEPAHFYNTTEFGLRRWFTGFANVDISVSPNFNPYYNLSWMASDLLLGARETLSWRERRTLGSANLRELARVWQTRGQSAPKLHAIFRKLPDTLQRRLAGGFQLVARRAQK